LSGRRRVTFWRVGVYIVRVLCHATWVRADEGKRQTFILTDPALLCQ